MPSKLHRLLTFAFFLSFVNAATAQVRLDEAKEKIKERQSEESTRPSRPDRSGESRDASDRGRQSSGRSYSSLQDNFLLRIIGHATYGVFFGYYRLEEHLNHPLSRYPFCTATEGNHISERTGNEGRRARIDVTDRFLVSNTTLGNQLSVRLRPTPYFFFEGSYTHISELFGSILDGSNGDQDRSTRFSLINATLCYDRIRTESFNLGWLIGWRHLGEGLDADALVTGLQMEVFMGEGISLTAAYKGGFVYGLGVNESGAHLRFHFGRYAGSIGLQRLVISDYRKNMAAFGLGLYL
jgi:hypothetical protein